MSWVRVESTTIAPELTEGMEARIADPLWMLGRQWQTGEFKGDDAANPLLIRATAVSAPIDRLTLGNGVEVDLRTEDTPLEPLVEREPIRTGPSGVRVRMEIGGLLMRSLRSAGFAAPVLTALRDEFPVSLPADDGLDPVGFRRLEIIAARACDGVHLAAALAPGQPAISALADRVGVAPGERKAFVALVSDWLSGPARAYSEPERFVTWNPQRMEYRFELSGTAPDGSVVSLTTADGYAGGRLEWYSFDRSEDGGRATPQGRVRRIEVLPTPLRFAGTAAERFWEFEEGEVSYGLIETAPQDLARMAVAQYALLHGDDWMMIPLRVPVGTVTEIVELEVLDDFGRVSSLRSAAVIDGGSAARPFKFFELTGDANPGHLRTPLLFVPPTVETTDAGRPLEDVRFLRDEMANVAWAVEQRVESPAGRPVDLGARLASASSKSADTDQWRYVLGTPVPDNWVPLIPVRLEARTGLPSGSIMFQRGRMPVPGTPNQTHGARGKILIPDRRLLLHEEEIPRTGVRVVRRYQSARDSRGRLHTWVARRKGPGRGEGHSGLSFDDLRT
jgi:hypothetical protein